MPTQTSDPPKIDQQPEESPKQMSPSSITTARSLSEKRGSTQSSITSSTSNDDMRLLSSNADYDHIRNKTLMFFLDRLFIASKDGVEARTLHELSCLFGTKDFTKEMRQIVGASRNGLRKFLESYPSLFTIEGDKVYLSQLRQDVCQPSRDYNREAVEYFSNKLVQFGASIVPIKNLFGYRSQASQEVRHISGMNTKEFKQFLRSHEDIFELLADEHVILKSALRELESRGETQASLLQQTLSSSGSASLSLQQASEPASDVGQVNVMDPYLNKQFAHLIEACLRDMLADEAQGRVKLDYLHTTILQDRNYQLFLKLVKTMEDLRVFLRMHPKIFRRFKCDQDQCEYVTLLSDQERRELEQQAYPTLTRQQSTLEARKLAPGDATHDEPLSLPAQKEAKRAEASHPPASKSARRGDEARGDFRPAQSSLRATAQPFVPSSAGQQQADSDRPVQRSSSSLASASQQPARPDKARGVIDPRQALKSYLLKASAVNASDQGPYSPAKQSNGGGQWHQSSGEPLRSLPLGQSNQSDDMRTRTVNIVKEASNIITRIMTTSDAVAFDCKGFNLGFNGQITLIQFGFLPQSSPEVATYPNTENQLEQKVKPEVCIFDLITNPELAYCLKPLLESEQIVKVVHDVRNKSNALYIQFGIMLNHVFDTQVANLVIQQQDTGKPAYKSRYISMSKLCEVYGDDELMKYRNLIKSKTRHSAGAGQHSARVKDANYWRTRPLNDAMIYESTLDVYCLVGGIYQNLRAKIKPEYEPLFKQLNLEGVLARIKPDEIKNVRKERKIDLEVIELKRKLYSDSIGSIVLSNREIRLLRHVDLTEEVRQKIQQCKKVAKKIERLDMKAAQLTGQSIVDSQASSDSDNNADQSLDCRQDQSLSSMEHQQEMSESQQVELTGLSNLMESSMFDELKDKMIESSSLLESLEDDDDDEQANLSSHSHSHVGSQDCCRCLCHHRSLADANGEKANLSLKSTASSAGSSESRVADMAIQCDLLS